MKKNVPSENFLDKIPLISSKIDWKEEDGNITILIENKGIFNRIAQFLFNKPKVSQVHLDEMGNFIWPLINGNNTVDMIAQEVKSHFKEKCEPLYERLITYFSTLKSYNFIEFK